MPMKKRTRTKVGIRWISNRTHDFKIRSILANRQPDETPSLACLAQDSESPHLLQFKAERFPHELSLHHWATGQLCFLPPESVRVSMSSGNRTSGD